MCYFKCNVCGKFISFTDLDTGKAIHRMITPDSDISIESFKTLCAAHNQPLDLTAESCGKEAWARVGSKE